MNEDVSPIKYMDNMVIFQRSRSRAVSFSGEGKAARNRKHHPILGGLSHLVSG